MSFVFIEHGHLATWQTSCEAANAPADAACFAREFITLLIPNVVVIEDVPAKTQKSANTRALLEAIRVEAERGDVRLLSIERERPFRNREAEATYLAKQYPELADKVPKRRFFENEPHHSVLFEALALADQAVRGSSLLLASKM
ncbi:hypothetical protein [Parasphingopyxis sp.]|uniref:hypothetical protein n=1 Tax=Parasphingopyxis sp. TaxID=1920299 RepID=UPI003F9F2A63